MRRAAGGAVRGSSAEISGADVLAESIAALAAMGGAAVVQAAGTDAWAAVSVRMRRLLGGSQSEGGPGVVLLERTTQEVSRAAPAEERERVRAQWEGMWCRYLEAWLEGLDEGERASAAGVLREVGALVGAASAQGAAVQAGRDVVVRAESGSVAGAAVRVEGGIHLSGPFPEASGAGR
ncbi:hypothetical protein Saso_74220 [Streptomyces asoensis]|uniref:Uncharacterized protein n=1 Tax=Streptomyces asoensis TaxID=249586 RepID=A0ABQ3SCB6_9ACTN|nr:hypothetical protein GCM10010496_73560 [Streptomyces asoensis]GHI65772.1 hypothetical protein Saso_74220 [Streptomyces asoensis]